MRLILSTFALFSLLLFACSSKPVFHKSHYTTKASAPFSDVVQVKNMLYLSGQIGLDHKTRTVVPGGLIPETHQTIMNIEEVLKVHGSDLSKVVKVTVILKNMKDFAAFNEIYQKYFPNKPARTTFAASGLALDAFIEIDVVAVK